MGSLVKSFSFPLTATVLKGKIKTKSIMLAKVEIFYSKKLLHLARRFKEGGCYKKYYLFIDLVLRVIDKGRIK